MANGHVWFFNYNDVVKAGSLIWFYEGEELTETQCLHHRTSVFLL